MSLYNSGLITMTVAATAGTYTRSSGSFMSDGFAANTAIRASGFATAGNNADKVISTVTDTVITVKSNSGLVNEGPLGSTRVVSCDPELPSNAAVTSLQYAQIRRDILPGAARRITVSGTQHDLLEGWGRAVGLTPAATVIGSDGIGFGYGPAGKRADVGSPSAPSQLQNAPGRILMLVPLLAGSRTVSIDARWYPDSGSGKRPRLLAPRDLDAGVQDDISAEAGVGGGLGFVTISLAITVTVDCAIVVYREQQDQRQDAWTLWDNFSIA